MWIVFEGIHPPSLSAQHKTTEVTSMQIRAQLTSIPVILYDIEIKDHIIQEVP